MFIADEIAQRSHDLDDALSAGLLNIESLLDILSLKKLHTLKRQIENLKQSMISAKERQHTFVSEDELLISRIASQVINYFINDVVNCFQKFLEDNVHEVDNLRRYFSVNFRVNRQLIGFSSEGNVLNDYLETIVKKQVINSSEVAAFDDKAERIVSKLFELYYDNPRLLHDGTLKRIFIEMRKRTDNVIHFQDGDIDLVNDEWSRIKKPEQSARFRDIREVFPETSFDEYKDFLEVLDALDSNSYEYMEIKQYCEKCINEYTEKKKILVRAICDFISGMTDTYAINEYRKLIC